MSISWTNGTDRNKSIIPKSQFLSKVPKEWEKKAKAHSQSVSVPISITHCCFCFSKDIWRVGLTITLENIYCCACNSSSAIRWMGQVINNDNIHFLFQKTVCFQFFAFVKMHLNCTPYRLKVLWADHLVQSWWNFIGVHKFTQIDTVGILALCVDPKLEIQISSQSYVESNLEISVLKKINWLYILNRNTGIVYYILCPVHQFVAVWVKIYP